MTSDDKPREIVIHPSANRPHLLLGGDRELVISCGVAAAALAFLISTWWSFLGGLCIWLVSVAVLARMGKADPMLRHVYLKHVRYAAFYPAKSGIESEGGITPPRWR